MRDGFKEGAAYWKVKNINLFFVKVKGRKFITCLAYLWSKSRKINIYRNINVYNIFKFQN